MGKHATYRKRGYTQRTPSENLPAPGAPSWDVPADNLILRSSSVSDVGGRLLVKRFIMPSGPLLDYANVPWATAYDVGEVEGLPAGNYFGFEEGNGLDYNGSSPYSLGYLV
jgi:hypothetical protein